MNIRTYNDIKYDMEASLGPSLNTLPTMCLVYTEVNLGSSICDLPGR
jgi:hypothetical protein